MINISELNNDQKEAVTTILGPVFVLAGAGSGKTKTLTYRVAYMIEQGIDPSSILALTFTNKAAKEMKSRIYSLIGTKLPIEVSTFHSFCSKQLRKNAELIGYKENFSIYDLDDQRKILYSIARTHKLNNDEIDVMKLCDRINWLKENCVSPTTYFNETDYQVERHFATVYNEYNKMLRENNAIDFADVLFYFYKLLQDSKIQEKFYNKFKFFLIDEYQDTNEIQWNIINTLAERTKNLFAVGDENQSIYSFRGADLSRTLNFSKKYKDAKVIKLEKSFRSTNQILKVANIVIKNNSSSTGKKLWSDNEGVLPYIKIANNGIEETLWIVEKIHQLVKDGYKYQDIAILYRNNVQAKDFEPTLLEHKVPYSVQDHLHIYQKKEVKDVVSYIKLLANPDDNVSMLRIINVPSRGIGKASLTNLHEIAQNNNLSIFKTLLMLDSLSIKTKKNEALLSFKNLLCKTRKIYEENGIFESIKYVLDESKYIETLDEDKTKNIQIFLDLFKDVIEKYNIKSANEYLEQILFFQEEHEDNENIKLLTIHGAKGLEFKIVFIPGLEEELLPNTRALFDKQNLEEERRLFYVAVTRAKELLYLSYAKSRGIYNNHLYSFNLFNRKMSRFLDEIPMELLNCDDQFVSTITKTSKVQKNSSVNKFIVGGEISHKIFGNGKILKISDAKVVIDFKSVGQKVFLTEVLNNFLSDKSV